MHGSLYASSAKACRRGDSDIDQLCMAGSCWSDPDSSADSHRNKENLRTIALALQNYYANYDAYPSPDFAGHSWRIRCLPFMFASPMYEQYRFMNHGIQR